MARRKGNNNEAPALPALERNPVILSLLILKAMGITEDHHKRFTPLWAPFWGFLSAYRDSKRPEEWTTRILDGILSGQATFDSGPAWVALNECLNDIWDRVNANPPF